LSGFKPARARKPGAAGRVEGRAFQRWVQQNLELLWRGM